MKTNKFVSSIIFVLVVLLSISSLSLLSNLGKKDNKYNSNNNNSSVVDFSNMTIACVGDSITLGSAEIYGYTHPYPTLVKDILGLKACYNFGIGSSTVAVKTGIGSSPMVKRYNQVEKDTDIISFMGGINDIHRDIELGTIDDTTDTTFYGALNIIANGFKTDYSNSFVFFMTILPTKLYSNYFSFEVIDSYNQAIKNIANKYNIPVLDTYNCWNYATANYLDGVHPRQQFMTEKLAPKIAQFIKDNYKK